MKDILTSNEVMEELSISERTLFRLLNSRQLVGYRIGESGSLRFKRTDLESLLHRREAPRGQLPARGMVKLG